MRERWQGLAFLLGSMIRAEPIRTVGAIAVIAAGRSALLVSAFGLRQLLNAATDRSSGAVLPAALLVGLGLALSLAAQYPIATVGVTLRERASLAIEERLARIISGFPGIEHFERPDLVQRLDLIRRGSFGLGEAVSSIVDNIAAIALLVATGILLAAIDPVLLLMVLAAVPSLAAAVAKERQTERFEAETADQWRPKKDLRDLAWTDTAGAELRLSDARDLVLGRQADAAAFIDARRWHFAKRSGSIQAIADIVLGAGQALGVGLVANKVANGDAAVGDIALVIVLAARLSAAVLETSEGLRYLMRLLRLEGRVRVVEQHLSARPAAADTAPAPNRLLHGIELDDVSFRYPGTDRNVISGLTLRLPAGSTVALVGENGVGKSTIVKLLCGFYQPTTGSILVDNVPLDTIDIDEWRQKVTATYQDFARLEFLALESIGTGDLPNIDDVDLVAAGADRAGAGSLVARLPDGLHTQLGSQFEDGTDLSGGEWQRIAHARASMRNEPLLIVLDEPTAALDPLAEQELFERTRALVDRRRPDGAIAVFVSHRFSTVRMADSIAVIENGTIVEHGTHAELIALRGRYATLFERQANAYR